MGVPSVFLRLSNCNLLCGGKGTVKDKKLHDGATWRCDTIETWMKGEQWSEDLFAVQMSRYAPQFRAGAHLVVTGGEPLLQQDGFELFLNLPNAEKTYIEVETNGTILPNSHTDVLVNQYNVSPKLANSGMPPELRINEEVIEYFQMNEKAFFKFVVNNSDDLVEMERDFVYEFDIPAHRVILMPASSSRDELRGKITAIAEMAKRRGYRFCSRLQLELWNQTVGV